MGITPVGMRKRVKCCTHHCFSTDWVCKGSKIGENILICSPKKQVIYLEQQNMLITNCFKSHNCIIPPLYHLNPFPDLLAPAASIFPFQRNGELLYRSRQCEALCRAGLCFSQQGFGQWSQAYLHSARQENEESPVP